MENTNVFKIFVFILVLKMTTIMRGIVVPVWLLLIFFVVSLEAPSAAVETAESSLLQQQSSSSQISRVRGLF
jgi:hypothetical protein